MSYYMGNYYDEKQHMPVTQNNLDDIVQDIINELSNAVTKFPTFPTDPLHALAVLGEEYGELNKAVLQYTYEPSKTSKDEIRMEAIQTAAMAVRFLLSLDDYKYEESKNHTQNI